MPGTSSAGEDAPRSSRAEQAVATRAALVRAGVALFGRDGYHATGTHDIVRRAEGTRGALYHHFPAKEDLFVAVLEAVNADLEKVAVEAGLLRSGDVWDRFRSASAAYLRHIADNPPLQRIYLLDGPAVLGWSRWRAIQRATVFGQTLHTLQVSIAEGAVLAEDAEALTDLLQGALNEGALAIAHSPEPQSTNERITRAFERLLAGLRGRRTSDPAERRTD